MKKLLSVGLLFTLFILFANARAQEFGFRGVGGRIGFIEPEAEISSTIMFGGHVDLGKIANVVALVPSLEYWSSDNFSQFSIHADGRYYYADSNIDPYIGAGLGIFFSSFDFSSSLGSFSESSTDLGLDLFGGLDVPISPQWVFTGEVKYCWTELNSFRILGGITYLIK